MAKKSGGGTLELKKTKNKSLRLKDKSKRGAKLRRGPAPRALAFAPSSTGMKFVQKLRLPSWSVTKLSASVDIGPTPDNVTTYSFAYSNTELLLQLAVAAATHLPVRGLEFIGNRLVLVSLRGTLTSLDSKYRPADFTVDDQRNALLYRPMSRTNATGYPGGMTDDATYRLKSDTHDDLALAGSPKHHLIGTSSLFFNGAKAADVLSFPAQVSWINKNPLLVKATAFELAPPATFHLVFASGFDSVNNRWQFRVPTAPAAVPGVNLQVIFDVLLDP